MFSILKSKKAVRLVDQRKMKLRRAHIFALIFVSGFLFINGSAVYATINDELAAIDGALTNAEAKSVQNEESIETMNYLTADGCVIKTCSKDNVVISAKAYKNIEIDLPTMSGYQFMGTIGYDISNGTSDGANSSLCHVCSVFANATDGTASLTIRNKATAADAKLKVSAYILYVKK